MNQFTVFLSPWLDVIAALYYWCMFITLEFLRYFEPTGLSFPRYWERRPPTLRIPWKTHYMAITAVIFSWALAAEYYHMHGAALGWTIVLLVLYFFFALWNGPMLQVVPEIEGVFQMAVAVNLALYLTVHNWVPGWFTIMSITFGMILGVEFVRMLRLTAKLASRPPRPPDNRND